MRGHVKHEEARGQLILQALCRSKGKHQAVEAVFARAYAVGGAGTRPQGCVVMSLNPAAPKRASAAM